jgi:hypothetical protein
MSKLPPDLPSVAYDDSLGRNARAGTWHELARGTFRTAIGKFELGFHQDAAALIEVSILEADELRDVYDRWPSSTQAWILSRGVAATEVATSMSRLTDLVGDQAMGGIAVEWETFVDAANSASRLCSAGDSTAPEAIENARLIWLGIHDRAVDRVSGMIDIAVRLVGEDALGDLWNFLMSDWYDIHEARYALTNQPWDESAHQLMVAIVDGMHAHLTGISRQGDIEVIEEADRIGFKFAACGSGGRSVDPAITNGLPRAGAPFGFAVTTKEHDWAWNKQGICSYCVHCCLLNELVPIDRLGYPTRVIDPPTWPASKKDASCTWWIYKHPSLVPDDVYQRVGRDPAVRPKSRG